MGNIRREDVLNCPLIFRTRNQHDAELVQYVLKAVMDYVRNLPDAEEAKFVTPEPREEVKVEQKKPATRRKKS